MSLDAALLQKEIEDILNEFFHVDDKYSRISVLTNALSVAIVNHIKKNAEVVVSSGSSKGYHYIV